MSLYEQWQQNEQLCNRLSYALNDIHSVLSMDVEELLENLNKMAVMAQECVEDLGPSLDDDQYASVVEMNHCEPFYAFLEGIKQQFEIFEVIKDNQVRTIYQEIKELGNKKDLSSDEAALLERKFSRLSDLESLDFPF